MKINIKAIHLLIFLFIILAGCSNGPDALIIQRDLNSVGVGRDYTSGTPATIQVNNDSNTISQNFDGNFYSKLNPLIPWADVNVANNLTINTDKNLTVFGGADLNVTTGRFCNDKNCYTLADLNRTGTTSTGVSSIASSGEPMLTGDVSLTAGLGISLNQIGQDIEIATDGTLAPAGANYQLQFYDTGLFGASPSLFWEPESLSLNVNKIRALDANAQIQDVNGYSSVSWGNRKLVNSSGTPTFDYQTLAFPTLTSNGCLNTTGSNGTLSVLPCGGDGNISGVGRDYTSGTPATIQVNNDSNTISQNFDGNFYSKLNPLIPWADVNVVDDLTINSTKAGFFHNNLTVDGNLFLGGFIDLNASTSVSSPPTGAARITALINNGFTRLIYNNESSTNKTLARDNVFLVKNTSGSTITKMQVVMVTGSTLDVPNVGLAKADSNATLPAVGLVLDDIANNAYGEVMKVGIMENVNTSGFSTGEQLWVSTTVAGGLTNVVPRIPNLAQKVGTVLVSFVGTGSILVTVDPTITNNASGTINSFTSLQDINGQRLCINSDCKSSWPIAGDGNISGGGTTGFLAKFYDVNSINNSRVFQAADGNLGIGTTTPNHTLDVNLGRFFFLYSGTKITPAASTVGTVQNSGDVSRNAGFSIISGTSGLSTLNLGDSASENIGRIDYNNLGNQLQITVNSQKAGLIQSTGTFNTFYGYTAGNSNTTGSSNTANGFETLLSNTTGIQNTAYGTGALYSNTTGSFNTAIGKSALSVNTTGTLNTAIGQNTLFSNTTGEQNTGVGLQALNSNTTGTENTGVGYRTLFSNTTGIANVAIGKEALFSNFSGSSTTAVGFQSLYTNTAGTQNTAIGYGTLFSNTNGSGNTGTGYRALFSNGTGGNNNTASGYHVMYHNSGSNNVAIGKEAGLGIPPGLSRYSNNILIGYQAGYGLTTGSNNIIIGHDIDITTDKNNTLDIGNIIYGNGINASGTTVDTDANIGIGTATPTNRLNVIGDVNATTGYKINNASGLTKTITAACIASGDFAMDVNGGIVTRVVGSGC